MGGDLIASIGLLGDGFGGACGCCEKRDERRFRETFTLKFEIIFGNNEVVAVGSSTDFLAIMAVAEDMSLWLSREL